MPLISYCQVLARLVWTKLKVGAVFLYILNCNKLIHYTGRQPTLQSSLISLCIKARFPLPLPSYILFLSSVHSSPLAPLLMSSSVHSSPLAPLSPGQRVQTRIAMGFKTEENGLSKRCEWCMDLQTCTVVFRLDLP
ncbi:hypothetical protein VNO77_39431 [Canavalia gladiata]|uniref:Uncharacterized protein n=1 Tax=Canavalia gladiata TaxID=3824 RepID=A0AAN9KDE4_CANGL